MNHSHGSVNQLSEGGTKSNWSAPTLVFGFILSFFFAAGLFLLVGHFGFKAPRSLVPFGNEPVVSHASEGELSFQPLTVSRGGVYIKALVGEIANPAQNEDYTLFLWFKLRHLPEVGESVGLVGKFESQSAGRPGYAISLEGAPDGVRPRVYVSTDGTGERWYSFASYPMNRRDWYLLAVSMEQRGFISTSLGRAFSEEQLVLLGAHKMNGKELPRSAADLVVGAFGASRFRGQIGPFGVLSGGKLAKNVGSHLHALQAAPGSVPSNIPLDVIRVWGSPTEDRGPNKATLITSKGEAIRPPGGGAGGRSVSKSGKETPHKSLKRLAPPKKVSKGGGNTSKVSGKKRK